MTELSRAIILFEGTSISSATFLNQGNAEVRDARFSV